MIDTRFDHNHLYIDEKPFIPTISSDWEEEFNTYLVQLDASPSSLLRWEGIIEEVKKVQEKGKYLIWQLDFDFSSGFEEEDPIFFSARNKAVEYWVEKVFPLFSESTLAVSLYQGELDSLTDDSASDDLFFERERIIEPLLTYLQKLAISIPESISIMAAFDVRKIPPQDLLYHFRRDRFAHILLALRGSRVSYPSITWIEGKGSLGSLDASFSKKPNKEKNGFLLPERSKCTQELLQEVDQKYSLQDIRFLYEDFATDEWEELDRILVVSPLSEKQKRICMGFEAAGGEVIQL